MTVNEVRAKMVKSLESLKVELSKIRTGRASTVLLDTLIVECYGSKMPLKSIATVSAPEARLLTIQPWDMTQLSAIEKAIQISDLGLVPTNDGKMIRIQIPPLSGERRQELIKIVKRVGEEARVAIRMIRRDANESLKKQGLSDDQLRKYQNEIQKVTDAEIQTVDALLASKEKDILNV